MTRMSRNKGASGEREFARLLSEALGTDITRDLSQSRDGGSDILCVPGWVIEVRRRERLELNSWWQDVSRRPVGGGNYPALAYRQNRQPWRVMVPLASMLRMPVGNEPATLTLRGFVQLVKSRM